jgi:hypothetical protein
MARIRTNNVFGTTTDNPLTAGAVTMNSAGLANLGVVAGSDEALITLDPNRVNGAPEIVRVTAHTGSAASATIVRGAFGTAARSHPLGTEWEHAPVAGPRPAAGTVGDFLAMDPPACRAKASALTTCTNGGETAIALAAEDYDTDTMHDTVTNNSRVTFKTAGLYVVTGLIPFDAAAAGKREAFIRLNGSGAYLAMSSEPSAGVANYHPLAATYKFAINDYIELRAFVDGANVNTIQAATIFSTLTATWIGSGD